MSEDQEDSLAPSQRQAIQKAWDILTEHFDRVLLVTDYDEEDVDGKIANSHQVWWHGGSLSAIGMAEYAKDRLLKSGNPFNEPEK